MRVHLEYVYFALISLFCMVQYLHRFIFRIMQIASVTVCTMFAE